VSATLIVRERVLVIVPDATLRSQVSRALSSAGFVPLVADSLRAGAMYLAAPFPRAIVLEAALAPHEQAIRDRAPNAALLLVDASTVDVAGALRKSIDAPLIQVPAVPTDSAPADVPPPSGLAADLGAHVAELENEDYFSVLGVPLDASTAAIRKSFLALAKEWHPSRFGLDATEVRAAAGDMFIIVKRAYDALMDPKKRAHFAQQAEEERARTKKKKTRAG
jgi:hypothetical protein